MVVHGNLEKNWDSKMQNDHVTFRKVLSFFSVFSGAFFGAALGAVAQTADAPSAVQEVYRDWIVRCEQVEASGERICEMRQELREADSNQLVLAVSLQLPEEPSDVNLTLLAPFGVKLSQPIELGLAETPVLTVPYRTCLPRGCFAVTTVDAETLAQLRDADGGSISVRIASVDDQFIDAQISLIGFSSALTRLEAFRAE